MKTTLVTSLLCWAACSPVSPHLSDDEALRGKVTTPSCSVAEADMIDRAVHVGNFVAMTAEFQACVSALYRPCSSDNTPTLEALLASTQSANDSRIGCADLGSTYNGLTSDGDEHAASYTGSENIRVNTSTLDGAIGKFASNSAAGNGVYVQPFGIAGIIWHEVMHVHGFQHGDNTDAAKASAACGYKNDPSWSWNDNSGPYAVETCMNAASANYGHPGPTTAPSKRGTLVDKAFLDNHKRNVDAKRNAIFQALFAGGYTPAQLYADTIQNGVPSGATPVSGNGITFDELYDHVDSDYFSISLPSGGRVVVALLFPNDATAWPTLTYTGGLVGAVRDRSSVQGVLTLTLDLPPGNHVVAAHAGASQVGAMPITLWVAPAMTPAPTGCRGAMICDGTVSVNCDSSSDPLQLQRMDGSNWTLVDEEAPIAGLDPELHDSLTASASEWRSYRVCTASHGAVAACSEVLPILVAASHCSVGAPAPSRPDCTNHANWTCNPLAGGVEDCHCGPYLPKTHL